MSYNTIQQHQPLRVPSSWGESEKRFVAQLEEVLDDLYRRFNRLRMEDLGKDLRNRIIADEDSILEVTESADELSVTVGKIQNGQESVGALENTSVKINTAGIEMKTGGEVKIKSGTLFSVESGGKIEMYGNNPDSYIIFGNDRDNPDFAIAPGGQLTVKDIYADTLNLKAGNFMTMLQGSLATKAIVSSSQPSGHNILWIKPNASSVVDYSLTSNFPDGSHEAASGGYYPIKYVFTVPRQGNALTGLCSYGIRLSINCGRQTYLHRTVATLSDGNTTITVLDDTKVSDLYVANGGVFFIDTLDGPQYTNQTNLTSAANLTLTVTLYLTNYINFSLTDGVPVYVRCKSGTASGEQTCELKYIP